MSTASESEEADLAAAQPNAVVKLASVSWGISGLFVLLAGLQIVGTRWYSEWPNYVPYVQLVLGAGQIVMGAMLFRARRWAAYAGVGLAAFMALGMFAWLVYVFTSIVSCVVYIAIPLTFLATLLGALSIPAVNKTAAARERLATRGLSLGL